MTGTAEKLITFLMSKTNTGLLYDLKEHKEKRTLTQNAYYWVLIDKVAGAARISKPELHNRLLRQYGVLERVDGFPLAVFLPDTENAEKSALEATTYHLRPTSVTKQGSKGTLRQYVMLKGSHDLNTTEMAELLDGIIQEARQLGIETMTPAELERLRAYEAQKNQSNKHTA